MILTGQEIGDEVDRGRITLDPFTAGNITTNSYDLTLGDELLRYTAPVLDPRLDNPHEKINIPETGLQMRPGDFLLGSTRERLGSNHYVPIIHAKSGTARMGLFVHVTADLIDIGSIGNSTLQLFATLPVTLYPGMPIAQVSFWVPKGTIVLYKGKYQNSRGPQPSRTYQDWENSDDHRSSSTPSQHGSGSHS